MKQTHRLQSPRGGLAHFEWKVVKTPKNGEKIIFEFWGRPRVRKWRYQKNLYKVRFCAAIELFTT